MSGSHLRAAVLGLSLALGTDAGAASSHDVDRVRTAITALTSLRVGAGVEIQVEVSDVRLIAHADTIVAAPDIGARFGQPARFTLFAEGRRRRRIGEATATVSGVADVVRVRRPVVLGGVVEGDDVEVVRATIEGMRFAAPPSVDLVVGARATRFLPVGSVIAFSDVMAERMVKAGDHVRAVVRLGAGVTIEGVAVALQSGERQQVISVMNPDSRQTRRGRVVGRGEVEVVDVR